MQRPRTDPDWSLSKTVPTPSTVNILTDVVDPNDGKTSLREAVALFNTAPDDFGNNSINFDPALNGKTVVLTAGELAVTGKPGATKTELSLDGSFSRVGPVIISGNNASRLFNVSSGITLNINQLKFTGGKADKGGAILNAGTLKLTTLTFDGNEATTADGGGAVYLAATGKLSITGATFSNNKSAGSGGAILDFGSAGIDVTGSTFSGNTAAGFGGAISGGNLNVSNSTFSGNTAGDVGGGLWTNGQLQSTNTTIVLNTATGDKGGGLFVQAGVAKLNNTLVGGNTGGDIGGTVDVGSKNNFIADPATAGGLVNAANGNILGDGAGALLALNKVVAVTLDVNTGFGPPYPRRRARRPAVDKGDKTLSNNPSDGKPLTTDARGSFSNAAKDTLRIAGENADIGAFEYQNTPPTVNLPTNKLTILEDSIDGFTFTGTGNTITVSDDGIGSTIYDVSLKTDVVVGKISLGTTNGLVGVTGNGTDAIAFTVAKLSDLNAALASLKALAFPDKNGSIGVTVTVNDKSSGPGDALSNFSEAGVTITAIVDPPSITSATTAKDKAVDVVLSRNKVDGNEISHFQVTNLKGGTLSYVGPESVANAAIQVTVGKAFFFAGSFFNLTPDPDTKFTFTPTPGFEGIASFDIQVAQGVYAVDPVGQPPNPAPEFGGPIPHVYDHRWHPTGRHDRPDRQIGTAADVGAAANGAKTYDFTVTYTDDVQIDFSTLDGKDVRVTGPVGFNTLANFVSSDLLNNGSPRTVTYRIVPPGGSWDSTDNGTYTIAVEASQVLDKSKNPVAASNLGKFTVNLPAPADTTAPTAKLGTAGAVTAAGTTTYDFTVTYSDDVAVDATTLDGKDVRVTGPGTFNQLAAFVKADTTGNGTPRTVTYRITPVGGFTTTEQRGHTPSPSKQARCWTQARTPWPPAPLARSV